VGILERTGTLPDDLADASLALARAFGAGATMWCLAPGLEAHARHLAVEFVHPVIMGKRALPAVAVAGADALALLRVQTRPGDVLVAVAGADEPTVGAAMRRCRAWGIASLWIGAGPRPAPGAADVVLWSDDPRAPYSGGAVLLYHLLWELTHVCFEHAGLLRDHPDAPAAPVSCADEPCITCSDEGRLAEILSVEDDRRAQVRTPAGVEAVDLSLVDDARPGDLVIVHAGSALSVVER